MSCRPPTATEWAAHKAELAREREWRQLAQETLLLQARAIEALVTATRVTESVTQERDAVTLASRPVTQEGVTPAPPATNKRAKSAARSRSYRLRHRSVTAERDGVTVGVTQEGEKEKKENIPLPLPPSPQDAPDRGRLAVVQSAARDARPPDVQAGPLPPEVQALGGAWDELVAPHGWPAWPTTPSKRLVEDVLRALQRRPLEAWRRVFALVPRSPVCRGELQRKQRADMVWLLVGRCGDGGEPAEKLLTGGWSLDPEPHGTCPPEAPAQARPEDDTPAGRAWTGVLARLREEGKQYALQWLGQMRAREVYEGHLVLEARDRFAADWVREHCDALLQPLAREQGLVGVRYVAGEVAP